MGKPRPADLLHDEGVLLPSPVLELFDWDVVRSLGGLAVLPLKGEWLRATAAGVEAVSLSEKIRGERFSQAIVHLQKGKAATAEGVSAAWNALENGGRLLLVGSNDLGIKSAIRKLGTMLRQEPEILRTRAHSRVAAFRRGTGPAPEIPTEESFEFSFAGRQLEIRTRAGVFSAGRLDRGSSMLLEELETSCDIAPRCILDLGCGAGVLALAAAVRFPAAEIVAADHDRRAISLTERNGSEAGVGGRLKLVWWDALCEELPGVQVDFALVNPPFHQAQDVNLEVPRAFFRRLGQVMRRGGIALIVSNNTLPYERELRKLGRFESLREVRGYKILRIEIC